MKMNYFLNSKVNFGKQKSSFFTAPACIIVLFAFLLPGILGTLNANLSFFGSIVLLIVAIIEKKSMMVRFDCLQYCFTSIFCNITLTLLSLLSNILVFLKPVVVMLSLVIAVFMIFVFLYSIFLAFQYKGWKVPKLGSYILDNILKYNG